MKQDDEKGVLRSTGEIGGKHRLPLIKLARTLILFFVTMSSTLTYATDEKIYHTGLDAKKGNFSVSPDGRYLIFDTNLLSHGLRLLNLVNSEIQILPSVAGRALGFPSWSPDGKQVALVSAEVRDNQYKLDGMEIVLLNTNSWQQRRVAVGEGVKFFPFFSADGKMVYYFKGKKRGSGKSPASRYDLFAIDLANGQETQLTDEAFYQAEKGDDDKKNVLFSAIAGKQFSEYRDALGNESSPLLILYNKAKRNIEPIRLNQIGGFFQFSEPKIDKLGNLYFISAKKREGGGNFLWFLIRANSDGNNLVPLVELPISLGFDIAKNTGEIYVMDKQGKELIFRKLTTIAAH